MEINTEFDDPLEIKVEVDHGSPAMVTETDAKTEFHMTLTNAMQIVHVNSEELIFPDCLSSPKHEIELEMDPLAMDSEEFTPDPVKVKILASYSPETEEQEERKRAKKAKVKTPDSEGSSSFSFIDNLPLENFEGEKNRNQNSNKNKNDKKNSSCSEASSSQTSVRDAGVQSLSLPFTCFECLQKFPSKPALKSHIDQSHALVINNTNKRPSKGKSKADRNSEINSAPNFAPTFQCRANVCNQVFFSPFALDQHTRSHKIGPGVYFTCSLCPETFAAARLLKQHMLLHVNVTPFKCSLCSLYFKSALRLKNHLQSAVHNEDFSGRGKVIEIVCETEEEEDEEEDEEDKEKDARDPLEIPASNNSSESLTSQPDKIRFKCNICPMVYLTEKRLAQHIKFRSKYAPIKCTKCPEQFCMASRWVAHFKRFHGGNPFDCTHPGCSESFRVLSQLKSHDLQVHDRVEKKRPKMNYKCSVDSCGKLFYRGDHLKRHHENVHIPVPIVPVRCPLEEPEIRKFSPRNKRFECVECKTFYKYALGLQVHLDEYHKVGREAGGEVEVEAGEISKEVEPNSGLEPEQKIKQEVGVETGAELELELESKIKSDVMNYKGELVKCHGEKEAEENCGFMEENIVIKQEDIKVTPDVNFFLS